MKLGSSIKNLTIRNATSLNPILAFNFQNLVHYGDLPFSFNLCKYQFMRYSASFYGLSYNKIILVMIYD